MRLIDAERLMVFAKNHKDGAVDVNDIARFPSIEAIPVSVIEDIKAEIEHIVDIHKIPIFGEGIYREYKSGLYDALAIIDKHIAERVNNG